MCSRESGLMYPGGRGYYPAAMQGWFRPQDATFYTLARLIMREF